MHILSATDLSVKEHYKLLSGSVVPRPIAFVTTLSTEDSGVVNAAPFSFFNVVSADPPLLSVSISRSNGEMKDTARNILQYKELVIHVSTEEMIEDINETAAPLKPNQSELELTKFHVKPSEMIEVPGILEAKIRYECVLHEHIPIKNDQGTVVNDLILAKVVCYHISEGVYDAEAGYISVEKLRPVARLAGHDYASLGKTYAMARPTS